MSISLALSPDHGHSARPAGQILASGVIATSQNRNMQSAYTEFPFYWPRKIQKMSLNVMVSIFSRYNYADTVRLRHMWVYMLFSGQFFFSLLSVSIPRNFTLSRELNNLIHGWFGSTSGHIFIWARTMVKN